MYLLNLNQVGGTVGKVFLLFFCSRAHTREKKKQKTKFFVFRCDGKRGWFPSNYVQIIQEEEIIPPPPPSVSQQQQQQQQQQQEEQMVSKKRKQENDKQKI